MKIIVPGDLEKARLKKLYIKIFECPDCGCKFEATSEEYKYGSQIDYGPFMTCPCCGKKYVEPIRIKSKNTIYTG